MNDIYQASATVSGILIDSETSKQVSKNQRIVLDYLFYYFYAAAPGDLLQIDTSATAVINRKTLIYVPYPNAVNGFSTQLNLPLIPGEDFTVYAAGTNVNSKACAIVWYHIEDVNQPANSFNQQVQPCGLIDWFQGRCSS